MPKFQRPYRRVKRAISLAAAALSFVVFLVVLRVWDGPCGYDVYYYALQIKALSLHGKLLFFDSSLVYYALYLINCLVKNPVLSVQLLSSLSMAVIYYCLLRMGLRRGFSLYKAAAASIAVFNPASFYLLLEFTKNTFALALFFFSLLFLDRPALKKTGGAAFFQVPIPPFRGGTLPGLFFGLAAFFSHRIILVLAVLFVLRRTAVAGFRAARRNHRVWNPPGLIIAGAAVALALGGLVFWRSFFSDRMPPLDIQAPLTRLLQLSGPRLWPGERIFYILLQVSLVFLIPWTLIRQRRPLASDSLFGFLAWLFVFPFLSFSWDGTGFRLLIMAPLFAAPWLMSQNLKFFSRGAAIFFIAGSLCFSAGAVQRLAHSKGPSYARYERELSSLETLAAGRRLIAHRGLAGFLWFEKGIRTENFIPPAEESSRYLRLAFFFPPEIFEPYLRGGEPRPIALGGYTLIEEYIWQRFYQDRRDLRFLKSELNPWLPRPATGFFINEKTAALMSPVSNSSGP
jgi:hypothetical protein